MRQQFTGSILDTQLLERHPRRVRGRSRLPPRGAARTRSEFSPALAHKVNVEGTLNMLEFAQKQGESHGRPVRVLLPVEHRRLRAADLAAKAAAGKVKEDEFNFPTTMYGANKLYCEHLGRYYARHYKQLAAETHERQGGLPLHPLPRADLGRDGAQRRHERLRPGDDPRGGGRQALRLLRAAGHAHPVHGDARRGGRDPAAGGRAAREADAARCTTSARSPRAPAEVEAIVRAAFPQAEITTKVDEKRQGIVDTWPADVDDSAARRDWGHAPATTFAPASATTSSRASRSAMQGRNFLASSCASNLSGRSCNIGDQFGDIVRSAYPLHCQLSNRVARLPFVDCANTLSASLATRP